MIVGATPNPPDTVFYFRDEELDLFMPLVSLDQDLWSVPSAGGSRRLLQSELPLFPNRRLNRHGQWENMGALG
jgi:hypothetical protein